MNGGQHDPSRFSFLPSLRGIGLSFSHSPSSSLSPVFRTEVVPFGDTSMRLAWVDQFLRLAGDRRQSPFTYIAARYQVQAPSNQL
jgi:hypothetical protein